MEDKKPHKRTREGINKINIKKRESTKHLFDLLNACKEYFKTDKLTKNTLPTVLLRAAGLIFNVVTCKIEAIETYENLSPSGEISKYLRFYRS